MSVAKSLLVASLLMISVPFGVGCAAPTESSEAPADSDESEVKASNDAKLEKELGALIDGLETGGGEGDADPYKVLGYRPKSGEKFDDALLLKRLLPEMIPASLDEEECFANFQERPAADEWADLTSDEDPALAAKWKAVKKFFDKNMKNVRTVTLGWAMQPDGSIETGAVAQVIVGQTASGRVIAIWGIDIWT